MDPEVINAVSRKLREADFETVSGCTFVPVMSFESGSRIGLSAAVPAPPAPNEEGEEDPPALEAENVGWAIVIGDDLTGFSPDRSMRFAELIETPRSEFEDRLEQAAGERGLPAEPVLFSFPTVELVRAMIARKKSHFVRLALLWLLPTELRPLREEIVAIAEDDAFPTQLRDLATRLVVPSG